MKKVLDKPFVLFWQVSCHNEWCSGPEIYRVSRVKPKNNQSCPRCGWVARYGDGIRPIYDISDDPIILYALATEESDERIE